MKKRNYLKGLRVLLAILFFVPILLFFVDFSGVLPDSVHRLLHLQLMPALLGGTVGLIVFQFLLALVFGRIYCSTICPAGVFQDIINRLFASVRKEERKPSFYLPQADEPATLRTAGNYGSHGCFRS